MTFPNIAGKPKSVDFVYISDARPKTQSSRQPKPTSITTLIPEILLLVEQIRPTRTQIYNLRTPIPIFLQPRAFEAVECVTDPFAAAHDALVGEIAKRAFIADADQSCGPYVRIANRTFAVTFVAESAQVDACCFAAHDEIGMMARHGSFVLGVGGCSLRMSL